MGKLGSLSLGEIEKVLRLRGLPSVFLRKPQIAQLFGHLPSQLGAIRASRPRFRGLGGDA